MNIFVLSSNPVEAAQMQCDKHVVKMCLETAQMLSTIVGGPYKPTHANHPCTLWAASSKGNFLWLKEHGLALCAEYTYRYSKIHKSEAVIQNADVPDTISHIDFVLEFVQCMPPEYKQEDAVAAYRAYYHSKAHFAKWTKRPIPYWWNPAKS